jgi:hypothetical protein
VLKPVWEDLYSVHVAPRIYEAAKKAYAKLREKSISADFVHRIQYEGREISVVFIPTRGSEEQCFEVKTLTSALKVAEAFLKSQPSIVKLYLMYDDSRREFVLYRADTEDGKAHVFPPPPKS